MYPWPGSRGRPSHSQTHRTGYFGPQGYSTRSQPGYNSDLADLLDQNLSTSTANRYGSSLDYRRGYLGSGPGAWTNNMYNAVQRDFLMMQQPRGGLYYGGRPPRYGGFF